MSKLIPSIAVALLIGLASAPYALAQIQLSGGVSSVDIAQAGVSVGGDPQTGVKTQIDAGGTGVSVEAGAAGAKLELRQGAVPEPPASTPTQPSGRESRDVAQPTGGGDAAGSTPADPDGRAGASPADRERSAQSTGPGAAAGTDAGAAQGAGETGPRTSDRGSDGRARAGRTGERGVAPFLDFIEEVPRAIWAGLFALGLIAMALWLMWVRGRRRLERNAWVDAESGAMNVAAFEALLAQEWTRSGRYRRPLGLLLLDLEEGTANGGRRPLGDRRARRAWDAISARVREADTVAQLSRSRFAVICPESPHGSAGTLARALESALEAEQVHARVGMGERLESDRAPADLISRAAAGLEQSGAWAGVSEPALADERRPLHVAA